MPFSSEISWFCFKSNFSLNRLLSSSHDKLTVKRLRRKWKNFSSTLPHLGHVELGYITILNLMSHLPLLSQEVSSVLFLKKYFFLLLFLWSKHTRLPEQNPFLICFVFMPRPYLLLMGHLSTLLWKPRYFYPSFNFFGFDYGRHLHSSDCQGQALSLG